MSYSVGQMAELTGVTVRTLHHYDRIGLLVPSLRRSNGYRSYEEDDVERLQRILAYRELGLSLNEIATLLDDPEADRTAHLRRQEMLLRGRISALEEMIAAIQLEMEMEHLSIELTTEERLELFGGFDAEAHAAEAEERWGSTDEHRESTRRTKSYDAGQWRTIKAEMEEIESGFAAALTTGERSDGKRARALAERHRLHVDRWFYPCSPDMQMNLGELYVADPRFAEHYDSRTPGLARFVSDAIAANARTP